MLARSLKSLRGMFAVTKKVFIPEIKTFTKVDELNEHLEEQKAAYTVVYFRAGWNPECVSADKDIARLQRQYPHVKIVSVDSDHSLQLKKYYDIKYQPEAVLCLHGDEVTRHVGVDYDNLRNRLEAVIKLESDPEFIDLAGWVPYGVAGHDYYDNHLRLCLKFARQ